MCAMVFSGRNVDMRDKMPQTVPSAGFSPPCDYSAFEADCFDLSLLPCSTDCEVPLSPISIQHFLAMYSDPTTPPPMFHSNQDKDFDHFDHFKTMDEDSSHTNKQFSFENLGEGKPGMNTDTSQSPSLDASNSKEVYENFNTLKSNPASMTNVFENFGNLKSPMGQDMEVKIPTINVFQEFRSSKSPSHSDVVPEAKPSSSYQYHSTPVMLNIVKEEPSYMLSPCMNYNSPYAPSVSPMPSPSSSYASNLSPYPLSPSSQTGIKQEQTLDLQEILEESHFLQESINTSKKTTELSRSHDLSQKVVNFCNILMNNEKETLDASGSKSSEQQDPPKSSILLLGNAFSSGAAAKDDDLMSKSMALGNLLLGSGSTGAIPKQDVASTSSKSGTTLGDHTLLREVLKDTSFQRKFNLRPFSFAGMGAFVSDKPSEVAVKMEVDDESDTRVKEDMRSEGSKSDTLADLSREKIEPVLSLAIEQLRRDVDSTCNVLGIAPDPAQWTVDDVKAWLLWTLRQYNLPAIQTEYFNMDGVALAQLTEEEFQLRAPQCGSTLHAQLEIWKAACQEIDMAGILQWGTTTNSTCSGSSGDISEDDEVESVPSPTVGKAASSSGAATTTRAGGSHIHLWQFLKELLSSPLVHGSCIRWLDRTKGVFKIEDSVRVARLWGKRKNRPAMNYDKLSRSIRQYYKKGIMKKTERSQRLVYQFCHPYCL